MVSGLQLSLDDFEKVAVLGAGAFGQVLLVRRGADYYALKVLSKQHLLQTGLQVSPRCRKSVLCLPGTAAKPCNNSTCSGWLPASPAGPRTQTCKGKFQREPSALHATDMSCLNAQEHVKQERRLMAECDCVFLVRLVGGFQDAAYLYMVLEAAMGGEFFLYMQVRTHSNTP